jgi:6-pyruvoyltetrahydropterin/6-carboxytetrahydropterin synthase
MTMFTISKEFTFSASHRLDGLADDHPCGRLHGHNYTARVELAGSVLGDTGMLVDYGDLKPFARYLDEYLDHRHLNGVVEGNPTAERLAVYLIGVIRQVLTLPDGVQVSVGVSETPKTWAWAQ